MLHRRQIVHLVNRFYRTLESYKARRGRSDPLRPVTFYLCWHSVLFILKGGVISMTCFKGLLNVVLHYVPWSGEEADTEQ